MSQKTSRDRLETETFKTETIHPCYTVCVMWNCELYRPTAYIATTAGKYSRLHRIGLYWANQSYIGIAYKPSAHRLRHLGGRCKYLMTFPECFAGSFSPHFMNTSCWYTNHSDWQTDSPCYRRAHCESKKGATLTMDITLSILDRFAKFFHSFTAAKSSKFPTKPY